MLLCDVRAECWCWAAGSAPSCRYLAGQAPRCYRPGIAMVDAERRATGQQLIDMRQRRCAGRLRLPPVSADTIRKARGSLRPRAARRAVHRPVLSPASAFAGKCWSRASRGGARSIHLVARGGGRGDGGLVLNRLGPRAQARMRPPIGFEPTR